MLQRCHRVFLDCIDYESSSMGDVAMTFDMLSQLYCQKFNGQIESEEIERQERFRVLGMYKLRSDILDDTYKHPLETLRRYHAEKAGTKEKENLDVLWWVCAVIGGILMLLYIIGVYFTYLDDPDNFNRTFSNKRIHAEARNEAIR